MKMDENGYMMIYVHVANLYSKENHESNKSKMKNRGIFIAVLEGTISHAKDETYFADSQLFACGGQVTRSLL